MAFDSSASFHLNHINSTSLLLTNFCDVSLLYQFNYFKPQLWFASVKFNNYPLDLHHQVSPLYFHFQRIPYRCILLEHHIQTSQNQVCNNRRVFRSTFGEVERRTCERSPHLNSHCWQLQRNWEVSETMENLAKTSNGRWRVLREIRLLINDVTIVFSYGQFIRQCNTFWTG